MPLLPPVTRATCPSSGRDAFSGMNDLPYGLSCSRRRSRRNAQRGSGSVVATDTLAKQRQTRHVPLSLPSFAAAHFGTIDWHLCYGNMDLQDLLPNVRQLDLSVLAPIDDCGAIPAAIYRG